MARLEVLVAKHAPEVWEAHAQRAVVDTFADVWWAFVFAMLGLLVYKKVLPIAAKRREDSPLDPEGYWASWAAILFFGMVSLTCVTSAAMWATAPDFHTMHLIAKTLGLN